MYRFVQGDVGSGKTVVGAIGLYANYLAGYQGAMMAAGFKMLYFHLFFMKFSLGLFLLKDFLLAFTADGRNKNLSL